MSLVNKSKKLSWLLRHGAHETKLPMDEAGWAPIPEVLRHLRMSRDQLDEVVRTNNKSRLQVDGTRIRCSQGHSIDGTPVTQSALELSWARVVDRQDPLFHGTSLEALPSIESEGLLPMNRTHVHLAGARDAHVGKRANVSVLLVIAPRILEEHGVGLFESPNGVLLARSVPPGCITAIEPKSKRARQVLRRI